MLESTPRKSSPEIQNEAFPSPPRLAATEIGKALTLDENYSDRYRLQSLLEESLKELFPDERRKELIALAPGGLDLEKHAVRYLRSVGWNELEILLRTGRIAFPDLHQDIDQPLSPEHRKRLKDIFQSEKSLETSQEALLDQFSLKTQSITYRQAIYLCAAGISFDKLLNEHACGRGGGQVFSPFISVTTGGPMMSPLGRGVSIEVLIPFPRAFNNWVNDGVEQESLLTDLRLEDITRIYFDEDILMDDLLATDSQLVNILPEAIKEHQEWNPHFHRNHPAAITCWRDCENERLLPELWRDKQQAEEAKNHLRAAYRQWGIEGLANSDSKIIRNISEVFQLFSIQNASRS